MAKKNANNLKPGDVAQLPGSQQWATVLEVKRGDRDIAVIYSFGDDPARHRYRCALDCVPQVEVQQPEKSK